MATHSVAASAFGRAQEDAFLLLKSCGTKVEAILLAHAGRPLWRSWIEHRY